tara:strand:- start:4554 stop:5831 length:1278 start_codon:yes stop_codon:yes gene_type:complete
MELYVLFGIFVLLMLIGMPIAFCLAISSLCTALYMGMPALIVFQQINAGFNSMAMIAIPLFIFAGELMMRGGIADRMIAFANSLVGHVRGGLGQVNITSSLLMSGISGSPVADASAIGGIMVPQMTKRGYKSTYAVNITITSAIVTLVMPPSPNLIMYSIAGGGISIVDLFTAGILPGVLLAFALMAVAYIEAVRKGYPSERFAGFVAIGRYFVAAIPAFFLIGVIFGGVRFGIFTAAESACMAVLYVFALMAIVYRTGSIHLLSQSVISATRTTAMVLLIIGAAASFGWFMAFLQVPSKVIALISSLSSDPNIVLLLILLILLALGTFMDLAPMIIITTPIFLPIAMAFNIDPVHFGVILILAGGIGLCTPPVGTLLFVGCAVGKVKVGDLLRTLWPYYLACLATLLIVAYIPSVSLWLPSLFS